MKTEKQDRRELCKDATVSIYQGIMRKNCTGHFVKTNPIQTQTKPISKVPILQYVAKWGPSDYPCVFESAVYNLVLRDGNVMHSMPNGRNLDCRQTSFDGEYMKWQMHRRQMQ